MKIKTRKLIAAITATALLGSALGIGTYAISNSNNDFGFKGTYDLTAFAAEQASESTITVAGVSIDTTSTLTLTSTNNDYTLFVTVVDTDDMTALADINVGYTVGGNTYNGQTSGLSNVVYSSLTVKTGNEETPTATATAAELAEDFTKISTAKLVIAEVEGNIEETPALTITGEKKSENVTLTVYTNSAFDADAQIAQSDGKEVTITTLGRLATKSASSGTTFTLEGVEYSDKVVETTVGKNMNILSFTLAEGYTYTINIWAGSSGESGTRTYTLNSNDTAIGDAQNTADGKVNFSTACIWSNLSSGTYTIYQTGGNSRIAKIVVVATPVS
ncbi:MAG: hypothetical protein ACI4QI_01295 [Candidatus Coproplasma sp.]